ncbi:MAG: pyruvate dehydrogenase (acetyl-transferring) E1 component subunit alpha [Candidatus Aminicenantes bacterium]|nr:pyruvate dehydrogenase (acetyl-transferring) E1 component subunit alpha [Candidatus Aminicenantes bacterium]
MFEKYDPLKDEMFRVMDDKGELIDPKLKPAIPDQDVIDAYKLMQFARTADLMSVSYQRQGRMLTYPPNLGQEAIAAAAGKIMKPQDWLVPAFRELGAYLAKGAKLSDIFLVWGGHEDGSRFSDAPNFIPSAVPIASQLPHAVGIGWAVNYKKEDSVVFAFVGDGGTSEGDFHEALNFAGVWKVPVIFIIQNNQYAISVPVRKQTASRNLAVKSTAYGIPGIKVDGNDFFAMYAALEEAAAHARQGKGAVLIEAVTFRMGAHTTSDDPTLYRTKEEEKMWAEKDPIKRLSAYLIARGLRQESDDEALLEQYKKEVEKEFAVYENYPPYKLEDVFKYHYKEMPGELKRQQAAYEKFLNSREVQK